MKSNYKRVFLYLLFFIIMISIVKSNPHAGEKVEYIYAGGESSTYDNAVIKYDEDFNIIFISDSRAGIINDIKVDEDFVYTVGGSQLTIYNKNDLSLIYSNATFGEEYSTLVIDDDYLYLIRRNAGFIDKYYKNNLSYILTSTYAGSMIMSSDIADNYIFTGVIWNKTDLSIIHSFGGPNAVVTDLEISYMGGWGAVYRTDITALTNTIIHGSFNTSRPIYSINIDENFIYFQQTDTPSSKHYLRRLNKSNYSDISSVELDNLATKMQIDINYLYLMNGIGVSDKVLKIDKNTFEIINGSESYGGRIRGLEIETISLDIPNIKKFIFDEENINYTYHIPIHKNKTIESAKLKFIGTNLLVDYRKSPETTIGQLGTSAHGTPYWSEVGNVSSYRWIPYLTPVYNAPFTSYVFDSYTKILKNYTSISLRYIFVATQYAESSSIIQCKSGTNWVLVTNKTSDPWYQEIITDIPSQCWSENPIQLRISIPYACGGESCYAGAYTSLDWCHTSGCHINNITVGLIFNNTEFFLENVSAKIEDINISKTWNYSGLFNKVEDTEDFSNELNDYLEGCEPDFYGYCYLPVTVQSDEWGTLEVQHFISFEPIQINIISGDGEQSEGSLEENHTVVFELAERNFDFAEFFYPYTSFEKGASGWNLGSRASISDEWSHRGNYSVKLEQLVMGTHNPRTDSLMKVFDYEIESITFSGSGSVGLFKYYPNQNKFDPIAFMSGENWTTTVKNEGYEQPLGDPSILNAEFIFFTENSEGAYIDSIIYNEGKEIEIIPGESFSYSFPMHKNMYEALIFANDTVGNEDYKEVVWWYEEPELSVVSPLNMSSFKTNNIWIQGIFPFDWNIERWIVNYNNQNYTFLDTDLKLGSENLIAYYKFEETSGTTLIDSMGNYNGTIIGSVQQDVDGIIGKGYNFTGEGNISITNLNSVINYDSDFSINFWINNPSNHSGEIFRKGSDFTMFIDTSENIWIKTKNGQNSYPPSSQINNDELKMVTLVYNSYTESLKGYLNNNLGINLDLSIHPDGFNFTSSDNLIIGSNWNGLIDEFSIYNKPLSEIEIQHLYNQGNAKRPKSIDFEIVKEPGLYNLKLWVETDLGTIGYNDSVYFIINTTYSDLILPTNNSFTVDEVEFICSANSYYELINTTLFLYDINDTLIFNETKEISGTNNITLFNYTLLEDGQYKWTCLSVDAIGQKIYPEENFTFTADFNNPVIILESPFNGEIFDNQTEIIINYTPQIVISDIEKCELWTNITGDWNLTNSHDNITKNEINNFTLYNLEEGWYKYSVWCNATSGASTFSQDGNKTFAQDINPPIINSIHPEGTLSQLTRTFNIHLDITEIKTDTCYYNITLKSSGATETANTPIPNCKNIGAYVNFWAPTEYILTVFVNDTFGRENVSSVEFKIEETTTPSPPPAGGGGGGSVVITTPTGEQLWSVATSEGNIKYEMNMLPGTSRKKNLLFENLGSSSRVITLTCEDLENHLCRYVEFDEDVFILPLGSDIKISKGFTIEVPDNIEKQKYLFNIIATDDLDNKGVISVEVNFELNVITELGTKLLSGKNIGDDFSIPYILIFFFSWTVLFIIFRFTIYNKFKKAGAIVSVSLSGAISLLIVMLL